MDAFEVLGIDRRLVISGEELRAAFREAGGRSHPDAGGEEAGFAAVQRAFAILASPAARLRHWLELEGDPVPERGPLPDGLVDLFGTIGPVMQDAEALLRKRRAARSGLARALLEPELQEVRERIESIGGEVDAAIGSLEGEFDRIAAGERSDADETARALSFLERWRGQLRERFSALAEGP